MDGPLQGAAEPPPRSRRGFAAMDPEKQREIARKGGRASGGRPENLRGVDRRAAGRKGGQAVVDKYGPSHMAEIGRKGGRSSGGFARMDPERQREIAAKGGRAGGHGAPGSYTDPLTEKFGAHPHAEDIRAAGVADPVTNKPVSGPDHAAGAQSQPEPEDDDGAAQANS